jgi:uncharacterized protein (TIGR00251 family)
MGRLSLKIVPGSSRDEVVGWLGDWLKVKVKAPPEKGRANEAVVALLADRLGIDSSSIAVVSGHGSPAKIVAVDGMDDEAIRQAFPSEKGLGKPTARRGGNRRVTRSGNAPIPDCSWRSRTSVFQRFPCTDGLPT